MVFEIYVKVLYGNSERFMYKLNDNMVQNVAKAAFVSTISYV